MTETTKERIENARKRLDKAEKWEFPTMDQNFFAIVELADEVKKLSNMNASLGSMVNDKIAEIKRLEAELAALKDKLNTSTKFLKMLHDEVTDLAECSCKGCRKPAGSCPGCVLFPCKETLECIDYMHPELIHQTEGDAK